MDKRGRAKGERPERLEESSLVMIFVPSYSYKRMQIYEYIKYTNIASTDKDIYIYTAIRQFII